MQQVKGLFGLFFGQQVYTKFISQKRFELTFPMMGRWEPP